MGSKRELSADEKNDLRVGKEVEVMMATAGWKIYSQVLSQILVGKRNELEQVSDPGKDGVAQVLRSENVKGSIIGIRLALELAPGMLTQAEIIRKSFGVGAAGENE